MKRVLLSAALIFSIGCDGFQNQVKFSDLAAVSDGQKTIATDKPSCEIDFADYELYTHLLAFELVDKTNVGFGFNLISGIFRAFGLKLKTERGEMIASMDLREARRPTEEFLSITGQGVSKKTEFNFDLDLVQLGLDVGYYKQTPLSQLTEKTLKDSLKNLRTQLNAVETDWTTKVVHLYQDGDLIVPAGSVAGIRLGDQFAVYNVEYTYAPPLRRPCVDELLMEKKTTKTPIAILEVTQLDKNASLLSVVERGSDEKIDYGARVEIHNLPLSKGEKARTLSRSVRLKEFKSEKLKVEGGADVDLSLYLSEQTSALVNQYGLYPRK